MAYHLYVLVVMDSLKQILIDAEQHFGDTDYTYTTLNAYYFMFALVGQDKEKLFEIKINCFIFSETLKIDFKLCAELNNL